MVFFFLLDCVSRVAMSESDLDHWASEGKNSGEYPSVVSMVVHWRGRNSWTRVRLLSLGG